MAKKAKKASASTKKVRSKSAQPSRKVRASESKGGTNGVSTAMVRVYRQGLGDCILVSLPRAGKSDFRMLIDCGVAAATADAGTMMSKVVQHLDDTTKHHIDVLAVTHEHWDHVSGFTQAKGPFGNIKFGEVWFAWTEDLDDPLATKLKKEHADALTALEMCAAVRAVSGQPDGALDLMQIAGMVGVAGEKTQAAMNTAKGLSGSEKPVYHKPGENPIEIDGTGAVQDRAADRPT